MKYHLLLLSSLGLFLLTSPIQKIEGVEPVNSTVIQQDKVLNDEQINRSIKDAIMADPVLAKFVDKINIVVERGVVTLKGVVDSSDVKSNIESKVKAVTGVKKVVNDIEVKKEVKVE